MKKSTIVFKSSPCDNQADAVKDCLNQFNSYFAENACTNPNLKLECEVVHSNGFKIVAQLIVSYV